EVKERIAILEDFDGGVAAVRMTGDFAVVAVREIGPPGTHAVEVVVGVVAAAPRVNAAEEQVAAGATARGGDAFGYGAMKRGQQQVDQLRLQVGVAADRGA